MGADLVERRTLARLTEEWVIDAAVRDVMLENPVTVPPEMLLRDLVDLFVASKLQGVPVVSAEGKLLGIVTEGDLILQEVEGDIDVPHFVPFLDGAIFFDNTDRFDEQIRKAFAATAADLMTDEVRTIGPGDTIHDAARKMVRHDVSRLPVVEGGRVVGMLSRSHIVLALARYEFHDDQA